MSDYDRGYGDGAGHGFLFGGFFGVLISFGIGIAICSEESVPKKLVLPLKEDMFISYNMGYSTKHGRVIGYYPDKEAAETEIVTIMPSGRKNVERDYVKYENILGEVFTNENGDEVVLPLR